LLLTGQFYCQPLANKHRVTFENLISLQGIDDVGKIAHAKFWSIFMKFQNSVMPLIMLTALFGMIVMMFDVPVGISPKRFGAFVFGAILVIVVLNLAYVLFENARKDKD
jgi:hypothetical protein